MLQRPAAIIFDFDGTLVDNMPVHIEAWIALCWDSGVELTVDGYYATGVGGKIEDAIRVFLGQDLTDHEVEILAEKKEFLYRYLARTRLQPIAGAHQFLHRLREAGYPLAIATSADHRNANFQLDVLGMTGMFDLVVANEDVTFGKPFPEIFQIAARRLGASPERCLAFEDSKPGLAAAAAAGMQIVGLTTTYPRGVVEALPGVAYAIDDYTDPRLEALLVGDGLASASELVPR
ncbi:MAG TPA: HAD family phosphatase [Capsulimonadaceae bacterium]|jgi:HAD superfamily hydrolase (TIGR01509 family)